jgi:hypothetical protein
MSTSHFFERAAYIRPATHEQRESHAFALARRQKNDLPWRCGKLGKTIRNSECKERLGKPCRDCSIPNILP